MTCEHLKLRYKGVQRDSAGRPALRLWNCMQCGTTLTREIKGGIENVKRTDRNQGR